MVAVVVATRSSARSAGVAADMLIRGFWAEAASYSQASWVWTTAQVGGQFLDQDADDE